MHPDTTSRTHIAMSLHRFRRVHVHRRHKPTWFVRADRNERQFRGSEARANTPEDFFVVAGIAEEPDSSRPQFDPESAPETMIGLAAETVVTVFRLCEIDRSAVCASLAMGL